jgi:hypothetical protein
MIQYLNLSKEQEKFSNERKTLHINKNKIMNDNLPFYVPAEIYFFLKVVYFLILRIKLK